MEQNKKVMLLVGTLCCVVLAGSQSLTTGSRESPPHPAVSGQRQSGVTAHGVAAATSHRSTTGRLISATTNRRNSTTSYRRLPNSGFFLCADNSRYINRTFLCNGRIDCPDSSDENSQLCNGTSCMNTFPCQNGECIGLNAVCNGRYECGDHSDEIGYPFCWSLANTETHTCANGQVLVGNNITCNGVYNCMDKSDEFNCSKCLGQSGQLMCDRGYRCVKSEAICDRTQDCFDGADESCLFPNNTRCNVGEFICPTGLCAAKNQIMSLSRCWGPQGPTREENLKYCKLPNVLCDGGNKCIPPEYRCDGKFDCQDGADEMSPHNNSMSGSSYKCTNGYCVPYSAMCNYVNDCGDNSDEDYYLQCRSFTAVNCSTRFGSNYWQCDNGLCIYSYEVQNGQNNCGDYSDEKNISSLFFTCNNRKKVLRSFLCDGRDNCGDNSDELDPSCSVNTPRPTCPQLTCPSGTCIRYTDICDGYNDCGDRSDEQECATRRSTCGYRTCPSGKCISSTDVCDGYNDCGDNSDEIGCPCNGHTCPSGICIQTYQVCNGINNCGDNSDEASCSTNICLEHTCPAGKCISYSDVCDGYDDCGDDSDESCTWTYSHTKVAVGVCVPGGFVIFVGGCFGAARRRRQTTARTTRTQAAIRAVVTTTTVAATAASNQHPSFAPSAPSYAQLPPSYQEVVGSAAAGQGVTNQAFDASAPVSK